MPARIYTVDTRGATDVRACPALAASPTGPVHEPLVTGPGRLAPRLDNLEGVAFGPPLPNDHPTLVIVTDDNFNAREINQLLAFEVLL